MKKLILTVTAILTLLALTLSLGACKIEVMDPENPDSTETSELSADNKEGSKELLDEFFKGTLESGNFVATTKIDDETRIESVVGDTSCTVDEASGTTFWGFKQGEEYISACSYGEDSHYYMTGEEYYNSYYCYFMSTVNLIDYFTDEDGTFSCVVNYEAKTEKGVTESHASLTFSFVTDGGTIDITATAENDLVKEFTYTMHDKVEDRSVTTSTTFTYGNATVELPDISDWQDISNVEEDDFAGEIGEEDVYDFDELFGDDSEGQN